MRNLIIFFNFLIANFVYAQYPPAAGKKGSTAIYKDSSIIISWAKKCIVKRGYQYIRNPNLGFASSGNDSDVYGKAMSNAVLSLGDAGYIICEFEETIKNHEGFDFAVFENGFLDNYLELAFVEVSSDGMNFERFPSFSNTDTTLQLNNFGLIDPTKIHNLAGKYKLGYGTPFDLNELAFSSKVNINNIKFIKIIDVIGSISDTFCTRDSRGFKINDPFPTPFESSGFDLDAIGILNPQKLNYPQKFNFKPSIKFSNPVMHDQNFKICSDQIIKEIKIYSSDGKIIKAENTINSNIHIESIPYSGIYYIQLKFENQSIGFSKIIVN